MRQNRDLFDKEAINPVYGPALLWKMKLCMKSDTVNSRTFNLCTIIKLQTPETEEHRSIRRYLTFITRHRLRKWSYIVHWFIQWNIGMYEIYASRHSMTWSIIESNSCRICHFEILTLFKFLTMIHTYLYLERILHDKQLIDWNWYKKSLIEIDIKKPPIMNIYSFCSIKASWHKLEVHSYNQNNECTENCIDFR